MPRPTLHTADAILDAARTVVLERGAGAATIAAIARASRAPTGSLYHRFGSRDALLARLWLRAAQRSQAAWLAPLEGRLGRRAAAAAALGVYDHAVSDPADTRLLISLRREDLLANPLPAPLASELQALNRPVAQALECLSDALGIPAEQVALATIDLPHGALRRNLEAGRVPPAANRVALERAVLAALREA